MSPTEASWGLVASLLVSLVWVMITLVLPILAWQVLCFRLARRLGEFGTMLLAIGGSLPIVAIMAVFVMMPVGNALIAALGLPALPD